MDDVKIKSFDPFQYQNAFHKYNVDISADEINQIFYFLKNRKKIYEQKNTFNHLNVLNFPLLKNLRYQVINILEKHNLILKNNWAQLYNKNNKHSIHIHPLSIYSGIIYLNPNKPSPTIFYDKNLEKSYVHKGMKNTLLLFPSHVPHEVKSLSKNEQRLVISFNTLRTV